MNPDNDCKDSSGLHTDSEKYNDMPFSPQPAIAAEVPLSMALDPSRAFQWPKVDTYSFTVVGNSLE